MKFLFDLFPVVLFFVAFKLSDIYVATGVAIAATVLQIGYLLVRRRRITAMQWINVGIIALFGGATLVLHDETFIKVKPTIIYGLFAAILGGGLLFGRSFIAVMFDQMFNLTPQGWRILTLRWALFFFGMAILNEIVWRTQTTDFWVSFKVFGVVPLTFVFAALQYPLLQKYAVEEELPPVIPAERSESRDP